LKSGAFFNIEKSKKLFELANFNLPELSLLDVTKKNIHSFSDKHKTEYFADVKKAAHHLSHLGFDLLAFHLIVHAKDCLLEEPQRLSYLRKCEIISATRVLQKTGYFPPDFTQPWETINQKLKEIDDPQFIKNFVKVIEETLTWRAEETLLAIFEEFKWDSQQIFDSICRFINKKNYLKDYYRLIIYLRNHKNEFTNEQIITIGKYFEQHKNYYSAWCTYNLLEETEIYFSKDNEPANIHLHRLWKILPENSFGPSLVTKKTLIEIFSERYSRWEIYLPRNRKISSSLTEEFNFCKSVKKLQNNIEEGDFKLPLLNNKQYPIYFPKNIKIKGYMKEVYVEVKKATLLQKMLINYFQCKQIYNINKVRITPGCMVYTLPDDDVTQFSTFFDLLDRFYDKNDLSDNITNELDKEILTEYSTYKEKMKEYSQC